METRNTWILLALLLVVTALLYTLPLRTPFTFDDLGDIKNNVHSKTLAGYISSFDKNLDSNEKIPAIRPVLYATYLINQLLYPESPAFFRLINVLIHLLNVLLVFLILRFMFGERSLVPLIVAAFFALAPFNTEPVNQITRRSTGLAVLFVLSSFLCFIRERHILATVFFLLALGTKELAVALPGVLLSWLLIFQRNRLKPMGLTLKLAPFILALALYLSYRGWIMGGILEQAGTSSRNQPGQPLAYLLTQPCAISRYILGLLFPVQQYIFYPVKLVPGILNWKFIAPLVFLATFVVVPFLVVKKERAMLLFFQLWLWIFLSPTSSFVPLIEPVAERRMYLSSVGLIVILTLIVKTLLKHSDKRIPAGICIGFLAFQCGLNLKRQFEYRDQEALWSDIISDFNEESSDIIGLSKVHGNLAILYENRKNIERAIWHYEKVIDLNPRDVHAHNRLGNVYMDQNEPGRAFQEFKKALELNPDSADAHNGLGTWYFRSGAPDKAISEYRLATGLKPDFFQVYSNLGLVYASTGNVRSAEKAFLKAIELNPGYAFTYFNLGKMLHDHATHPEDENFKKAIYNFEKGLSLNPEDSRALVFLGDLYAGSGNCPKALEKYKQARQLGYPYITIKRKVGRCLHK